MFDYKRTTHPSHSTVHSLAIKKNIIRDLSEISRGEGGRKQREGHNFLRLRKGRGHEKWAVKRGGGEGHANINP